MACKLKALNLLCTYLIDDKNFNLILPTFDDTSANAHYALIQHQQLEHFLNALPTTVYNTFTRYQTMLRHLESTYVLSTIERKHLLNYYHQSHPGAPRGALGYEWMSLSLETLQEEQEALLASRTLNQLLNIDNNRLKRITEDIKKKQKIMAHSTALQAVPLDLSIPRSILIKKTDLNVAAKEEVKKWTISVLNLTDDQLLAAQSSLASHTTSEDEFIVNFPAYLQLAFSSLNKQRLRDFCTQTLIAHRHVPLEKQETNTPLLCNLLYRAMQNPNLFSHYEPIDTLIQKIIINASHSYVDPLLVYEAIDLYETTLATPERILASKPHSERIALKATLHPALQLAETIKLKPELKPLINSYRTVQAKSNEINITLGTQLTGALEQFALIEEEAGNNQLRLEKEQKKLAQQFYKDASLQNSLDILVQSVAQNLNAITKDHLKRTLKLANQGPVDPILNKKWQVERVAKSRLLLTIKELRALYTRADAAYTIEKTGLTKEQAQELHSSIHLVLIYKIQSQMVDKIISTLKKARARHDPDGFVTILNLLALEQIPGIEEPAIVLLQSEGNMILRHRQVSALKTLLTHPQSDIPFKESVEKIIPGGGKSKVIMPILAEIKAEGDNLVIIEVPSALLATNHVDLNHTSQQLYGKSAYRFEFNRDSNCSPDRLEQLYQHFIEIITTKSYMVTTAESIQSIELKYLDLLLFVDEKDELWKNQIKWIDKITNLLHHHTDCMIDEVHQGLSLKKKLNYVHGEPFSIKTSLIKNALDLWSFIDTDFVQKAPSLSQDYDWSPFENNLASILINSPSSPLQPFVSAAQATYGNAIKEELVKYLTNRAESTCEAIHRADIDTKATLAFFKQEISGLLAQTLVNRLDEKYGSSKKPSLSPIEKTLAIPYAANNIPNERSRFGNNLVAINHTIQMMRLKGISIELLTEQIKQWHISARQELFQNPALKHLDDTPTARGFSLLLKDSPYTLSQIKCENPEQITLLHGQFAHNRTLMADLLQHHALKLIHQDSAIISSDSFNHVDIYRSVQAVSGTPSNHTTFHQRLEYDQTSSLGTDGYIIALLEEKKSAIS
ncbi:MAG: DUF3638 domain-containing protein, partial [bacterium]|nr:DUF3638 domain-containing protein [bacterium]